MKWQCRVGAGVAALLAGAVAAPGPTQPRASAGLEAESLPGELTEDIAEPPDFRLGPTPVSEVNFLMDYLRLRELFGDTGIRSFGWVEGGYSGASSGTGILSVQPRLNRFGNEFLLNEIGWVVEKPLKQDEFNLGFMMRYFAGANAALGAAKGDRLPARQRPFRRGLPRPVPLPTCRSSPSGGWTSRSVV